MKGRERRRVAVVTGTRAEYGLLTSTMAAIRKQRGLRLQLAVTGMHLLRKFGHTIDDILHDGWRVDAKIKMQSGNDDPLDQARGLARGVSGLAAFFEHARSDMVVVLGDRIEAMAGALAAVTTGRILAHIHGGDVAAGDADENMRHAITKLAHVHFAATRSARRRIICMGEAPWRVHWVGAPGLDRLARLAARASKARRDVRRALILHHPCGRAPSVEQRVMSRILDAVQAEGFVRTVIYPNSDRGHSGIIEAIQAHAALATDGTVQVLRSINRDRYLGMLMSCGVLVGNSSSGIIEAATAGTPSVNVGPRQAGRERSGPSVVDADETVSSVRHALRRALGMRPTKGKPTVYGDGKAGRRIAEILAKVPLDDRWRRKISMF